MKKKSIFITLTTFFLFVGCGKSDIDEYLRNRTIPNAETCNVTCYGSEFPDEQPIRLKKYETIQSLTEWQLQCINKKYFPDIDITQVINYPTLKRKGWTDEEILRYRKNQLFRETFENQENYNILKQKKADERDAYYLFYYLSINEPESYVEYLKELNPNKDTEIDNEYLIFQIKQSSNAFSQVDINQKNDLAELFNTQISRGCILGIILIALFVFVFAIRDSEDWKKEYSSNIKSILSIMLTTLLFLASLICFLFFIIKKISYSGVYHSELVLFITFGFLFAALGGYVLRFRPSPRSFWVKIRRIIAYVLIFNGYLSYVNFTISRNFIRKHLYGLDNNIGYVLGAVLAYCLILVIVWILLRHYKNEKYIPYKKTSVLKTKLDSITQGGFSQSSDAASDAASFTPAKKNILSNILKNKKRLMAYYLIYELVIFITSFILIIIDISNRNGSVGIFVAIFIVLSILPIGIYWVMRLLKESSEQIND